MSSLTICVPGERISKAAQDCVAGGGCCVRNGYVYATLAGFVHSSRNSDGMTQLEVCTELESSLVPTVGTTVSARVTNVNPRFCKCSIIGVEDVLLREPFRGIIRKEDVRATEKDKVEMYKSFRPTDIILARVISLGDAQSYLLSTAENELGVVVATSEAGVPLVPMSWCEMQCPKTLMKENRKVAKVQLSHIHTGSEQECSRPTFAPGVNKSERNK